MSRNIRSLTAKVARLYINGVTPDPEVERAARLELKEAKLAGVIEDSLTSGPAFTDEQRMRLAALIAPTGGASA